MVWLANAILAIVASAVSFFGLQLSKKTVFAATAIATLLAFTTAFVVVVRGLLGAIVWIMPTWAAQGFSMFMPTNLSVCIGALMTAKTARWIYDYHITGLKLVSYIT